MNALAIPRPALLGAIFIFNFIEFFQTGMVVFAIGPTLGQVNASPEEYGAITALYASVAVLAISQMTVLIQRFGWRDHLLAGVLIFVCGSWLCAASDSVGSFALGRTLMALGGGGFMTSARMMVNLIFPPQERVIGIAAFAGAVATGISLGPWAAGAMVAREAWGGIYLALAALAILGSVLAARYLPLDAVTLDGTPTRPHTLDAVLLAGGAAVTLYALQRLAYDWHGERAHLVWLLVAGIGLLAAFGFLHARRAYPFLHLSILRSRRFQVGLAIFSMCYVVLGIVNTALPQLVQRALGIGFEQAGNLQSMGMAFTPLGLVVLLATVKKRPHATKFYVAAFLMLALMGWRFSHLDPRGHVWDTVTFWIGLFGVFLIFGMATTAIHSFKDFVADNVKFSHAQQFKNMLGQAGLALGVGVTSAVMQERAALHTARLAEAAGSPAAPVAQQVLLLASMDIFWVVMWVGMLGAALLFFQRSFD
ncbi:MFS transporter [Massilia niastensis]|uniref:MFS transporter n=1 Tax=Massilia niastensis TaxID=544911 RepID=UPI000361DF7B|nr:MFS transporter [Massilia niastensis]